MTPKFEPEKDKPLFQKNVKKWRQAYPDFYIHIKEVFYSQKEGAALLGITAMNFGDGWYPATGKSIKVSDMSIFHSEERMSGWHRIMHSVYSNWVLK